jgi:hypothetical protein
MNEFPKLNDYKTPDGYFEYLPDQIMSQINQKPSYGWAKIAVAAMLLLGIGIWQMGNFEESKPTLSFEQESELYIESEFWTEEEVLSMSANPEAILDEILTEEMIYIETIWTKEEQTWF